MCQRCDSFAANHAAPASRRHFLKFAGAAAAIKAIKDNTTVPGHLPSLVSAISPAIKATAGQPGNALDNAIKQNVLLIVEKLKAATPILDKFVTEKKVIVLGAVYNPDKG